MPIVDMSRITAVGLKQDRDAILDALTSVGAVDVEDVSHIHPDAVPPLESWEVDEELDGVTSSPEWAQAQEVLSQMEGMIQLCAKIAPEEKKGFFTSLRHVTSKQYAEVVERESEILEIASRMEDMRLRISAARGQIARLQAAHDLLVPWVGIPIDLSVEGTRETSIHLGSLPAGQRFDRFHEELTDQVSPVHIEVLSKDESIVRLAVVDLRRDEGIVRGILKTHGFNPVPSQGEKGDPETILRHTDAELLKLTDEIATMEAESVVIAAERRADFEVLYDHFMIREARLRAASRLRTTRNAFVLSGWVPRKMASDIARGLRDRFVAAVEIRDPAADEDFPVMLNNPAVVRPYEVITDMFSTPRTSEMDPNPLMAPFFFILFGLMLNDAGYGLLLAAACAFLVWGAKVKGTMRSMCLLLLQGGLAGILSGVLFGSFFGDIVSVVSRDQNSFPTMWFNPLDDPVRMMIISMLIGVVHVFTGMAAKVYMLVRRGRVMDAIFDIGSWYMLLIGLGMLAGGGVIARIGTVMAILGAAMVILFSARASRNPVKRVVKGLYNLYGITGFLSDILSYTRILALGLAGGVIAMVVNMIGSIAGFGLVGIPLFIVVALGGHALNLALSALGAYVHTSRLQYVEFFSKFFEGGGRAWSPMQIQTRYTQIR